MQTNTNNTHEHNAEELTPGMRLQNDTENWARTQGLREVASIINNLAWWHGKGTQSMILGSGRGMETNLRYGEQQKDVRVLTRQSDQGTTVSITTKHHAADSLVTTLREKPNGSYHVELYTVNGERQSPIAEMDMNHVDALKNPRFRIANGEVRFGNANNDTDARKNMEMMQETIAGLAHMANEVVNRKVGAVESAVHNQVTAVLKAPGASTNAIAETQNSAPFSTEELTDLLGSLRDLSRIHGQRYNDSPLYIRLGNKLISFKRQGYVDVVDTDAPDGAIVMELDVRAGGTDNEPTAEILMNPWEAAKQIKMGVSSRYEMVNYQYEKKVETETMGTGGTLQHSPSDRQQLRKAMEMLKVAVNEAERKYNDKEYQEAARKLWNTSYTKRRQAEIAAEEQNKR